MTKIKNESVSNLKKAKINAVIWNNEYSPLSGENFLLLHTGYQTGRAGRFFLRWQGQAQPNRLFYLISGNGEKAHPAKW